MAVVDEPATSNLTHRNTTFVGCPGAFQDPRSQPAASKLLQKVDGPKFSVTSFDRGDL